MTNQENYKCSKEVLIVGYGTGKKESTPNRSAGDMVSDQDVKNEGALILLSFFCKETVPGSRYNP